MHDSNRDVMEHKRVVHLLEVPSQFDNPNQAAYDANANANEEEVTSSPESTADSAITETQDESKLDLGIVGESTTEEIAKSVEQETNETTENIPQDAKETKSDDASSKSEKADDSHLSSDFENSHLHDRQEDSVSVENKELHVVSALRESHAPARKQLHASYVDHERKSTVASSSVAMHIRTKSEPKLMSIRKIDSLTAADVVSI